MPVCLIRSERGRVCVCVCVYPSLPPVLLLGRRRGHVSTQKTTRFIIWKEGVYLRLCEGVCGCLGQGENDRAKKQTRVTQVPSVTTHWFS